MAEMREPTFLLLCSLAGGPKHGYAIRQDVSELSDGEVDMRTGTLYAALDRLSEAGWIQRRGQETVDGRNRFYYALTDEGRTALTAETTKRQQQVSVAACRLGMAVTA